MKSRRAKTHRKTKETDISAEIVLDGKGSRTGGTGIGFFDHMLDHLTKHSGVSLTLKAKGDPVEMPSLTALALPLRAQLQSEGGLCLEATYSTAEVVKNTGTEFKGKSD